MSTELNLAAAVARLSSFLAERPLTDVIWTLEQGLNGCELQDLSGVTEGVGDGLLEAALLVRQTFGRVNDLIHAAAIVAALPRILEDGERVCRPPSLAAGNDRERPYDLETNRKIAEFKLSRWVGADAMRKRHVFKDLVHLAADESGRAPHLFVVGSAPIRFLRGSRSKASWALDRFPSTRELFRTRYGDPTKTSVAEFTAGYGASVQVVDLQTILPELGAIPAEE